jgi:hypothetical protein
VANKCTHLVERVGFEPTSRHNREPDFEYPPRSTLRGETLRANRVKQPETRPVWQKAAHTKHLAKRGYRAFRINSA